MIVLRHCISKDISLTEVYKKYKSIQVKLSGDSQCSYLNEFCIKDIKHRFQHLLKSTAASRIKRFSVRLEVKEKCKNEAAALCLTALQRGF